MSIEELIASGTVAEFAGGAVSRVGAERPLLMLNPHDAVRIEADTAEPVQLVIVHTSANESAVELHLSHGAQVSLTDIYLAEAFSAVEIAQSEGSHCSAVVMQLRSANTAYTIDLPERRAENELSAAFVAAGDEHCTLKLTTNHRAPLCTSRAMVKGVAAGRATGEFQGLVYVAPDAQQTDAQQQSRNIEIGGGHIITMPQLLIYADDVRCSHGATVGQPDEEALFYMRQRGLSEADARRLQIEGFVNDILNRCPIEQVREAVAGEIADKLEKL